MELRRFDWGANNQFWDVKKRKIADGRNAAHRSTRHAPPH